jgi:tetratricopeptide (TPR) repeat protein
MERKNYWLIFLFLIFHGISAADDFKQKIYRAYISGEMHDWKEVVDQMERNKQNEPGFLLDLINYEYGYIGWCLGTDRKDEAEKYLDWAEENLEKLDNLTNKYEAEIHAYTAAFYGFKIGLKNWRAPFLGPKSVDHAEKALELDPDNFNANVEMGNIWSNMPEIFGGSDEKGLKYYKKALEVLEQKSAEELKNNWMYLNLLALTGRIEQGLDNHEAARRYFEKALKTEPRFLWVKNELLPSLLKELNE